MRNRAAILEEVPPFMWKATLIPRPFPLAGAIVKGIASW